MAIIDTLRALVDWKCNLSCSYCCNEIARFREQIKSVAFTDIDWQKYPTVCISGGEPLLFPDRIARVCRAAPNAFKILYTNGTLLNQGAIQHLRFWQVNAINVGLHEPKSFNILIERIRKLAIESPIDVRFHMRDIYRPMAEKWIPLGVQFRYWKMNDCDRANEDRVVITDWNDSEESCHQESTTQSALRIM